MRFRMDDDTIVDTELAAEKWEESTYWDGSNHISRATGQQWRHETLYRSRKGRYYLVRSSQWQGETDTAAFIEREDAARWLLANDHELPADLKDLESQVME